MSTVRLKLNPNKCLSCQPSNRLDDTVFVADCISPLPTSQQWTYDANTLRIMSNYNQECLDVVGESKDDGAVVDLYTCVNQPNEQFMHSNEGFLVAQHSGKCVAVASNRAGVCGRIQNGGDRNRVGYCLSISKISENVKWVLTQTNQVLAFGNVTASSDNWHSLKLVLQKLMIEAWVDDTMVFQSANNPAYTSGYVALISGWNIAQFDDFSIS